MLALLAEVARSRRPASRWCSSRSRAATCRPTCRPIRTSWPTWPAPPGLERAFVATLDEAAGWASDAAPGRSADGGGRVVRTCWPPCDRGCVAPSGRRAPVPDALG